jgi:hypothetical protein
VTWGCFGKGRDELQFKETETSRVRSSAVVLIALSATLVHLAMIQTHADGWPYDIVSRWLQGRTTDLTSANAEVDSLFTRSSADGNVLFAIAQCGSATPLQLQILSRYYYRGSYAIYPKRVYIADQDTALFGEGMLRHTFSPTTEWLSQHAITAIVRMTCEGRANVRFSSANRPPTS